MLTLSAEKGETPCVFEVSVFLKILPDETLEQNRSRIEQVQCAFRDEGWYVMAYKSKGVYIAVPNELVSVLYFEVTASRDKINIPTSEHFEDVHIRVRPVGAIE